MSARKMVQNLRDSGALAAPSIAAPLRTTLISFAGGLALGASVYLGALYGLPAIAASMQKPPPVVHYAKPGMD
jgi:Na+-driven multidrug efflux pump